MGQHINAPSGSNARNSIETCLEMLCCSMPGQKGRDSTKLRESSKEKPALKIRTIVMLGAVCRNRAPARHGVDLVGGHVEEDV